MASNLISISLFLIYFSTIISQEISQLTYSSGPIHSMTLLNDGKVLGGRSSGHEIKVGQV